MITRSLRHWLEDVRDERRNDPSAQVARRVMSPELPPLADFLVRDVAWEDCVPMYKLTKSERSLLKHERRKYVSACSGDDVQS